MDFRFSDEQNMLQETVRRFIAKDYSFAERHAILMGGKSTVWNAFAELGLLALNVPADYDGLEGGPIETLLVMGAMGEGLVLEPYLASAVVATRAIVLCGSEQQRSELLPALAGGEKIAVLAHDEHATCYDWQNVSTNARRAGDGFVLNGAKHVIPHGAQADLLLVSARLDGQLAMFVVPRSAVHCTAYRTVDGVPAADIMLQDVSLPANAQMPHAQHLADVLDTWLAALCAEAVGVLDKLLAATVEYSKNRKQFGQPIAKFQALQHRMADMVLHIEQARSMSYLAAVRCSDADLAERRRTLSAAKVVIGQACRFVGQQAVQLHGGMGVTDELDVSHYFKRLMAIELQCGSTDQHLEAFAQQLAAA